MTDKKATAKAKANAKAKTRAKAEPEERFLSRLSAWLQPRRLAQSSDRETPPPHCRRAPSFAAAGSRESHREIPALQTAHAAGGELRPVAPSPRKVHCGRRPPE